MGESSGAGEKAASWPGLREFFAGAAGLSPALLAQAVRTDQQTRWAAGQRVPAEAYLAMAPALAGDREAALEVIYAEFLLREERGEAPNPEEYAARFPKWAGRFREQIELHQALASAEAAGQCPDPDAPTVAELPTSASRQLGEIRTLLHKRLRALSTITTLGWGLTWTHKFFRLEMRPDVVWLIMVPGGLFLAFLLAATALVWVRRRWTFRQLRTIELMGCGISVLFLLWENYFTVYLEGATGGRMHLFASRDVSEMATLARHVAIVWFMVIVAYGALIPNTWRRCAAATGGLALAVLAVNALGGLWDGAIEKRQLATYLAEMATWLVMAVGFAIYSSHKINVLRQEAIEARKLGPYQLKRRLGTGGMGEVYFAEHVLLKQPCAVKLIRPERAGDPTILRRFEREVQATARLKHWNTVQIFDYGHTPDGTFYYVMEYLPGLNLNDLVKRCGPLPPERAVHLLRQVCAALREAHGIGLIHRDVKPSNIIACERGGVHDVAKLLDFGLVRAVGPDNQEETLTQEGELAGTPAYASPEQASGHGEVDARSDVYSLGAVAYFLLTGQAPFRRSQAFQVILAHLHDQVRPLTELRPDVPPDLEAIVLRCLDKDPGRRFPDVQSLEKALASCQTRCPWNEERAAAWWRRHAEAKEGMDQSPKAGKPLTS
jgi:eukaryotic-like serine/threonine-protein kinase